MARFINVQHHLGGQHAEQFVIGAIKRRLTLLIVLANVLPQGNANTIADKRPDRRIGCVTTTLHERDEHREVRANQAAAFDSQGQLCRAARLSTAIAPVLGARVLFDGRKRRPFDIDLLGDARIRLVEPQHTAAAGTGIEFMSDKSSDLLGREGFAGYARRGRVYPPMERFWPS